MKKIISMLLAALMVVTTFAFPVFAAEEAEFTTITEDMISAEGAAIEYDSYLSAYKITPDAADSTVTVSLTENLYYLALWVPATAADDNIRVSFENDGFISEQYFAAGHKFELASAGFEGENFRIIYSPSDTYSIYLFDKMAGENAESNSFIDLANGSLADYDEEYLDLSEYEVGRYTKYYWDQDIVFNESFFVITEKDGTVAPNAMMYEIDRVVSVKNSYLNKEYVYGEDYLIEDGKLVIPEDSSIPKCNYSTVYMNADPTGKYWKTLEGGYVMAGQYDMYFVGYMNITYTVKDTWDGPVPESKGMYLDNITAKLETEGETVKLLGLGDSIAGGANVSSDIGETGVAPYADAWSQMTSKAIQERYPDVNIEYDVIAQGGATATYAIEKMDEIVAYDPDLIMIEFGTNECMAGETDAYYIDTLTQAIDAINENLPDCDIILVAPIISNPLIFPSDWFYSYADALYSLEREGVAIADSTSVLQYLISRKDYIDMTGDFLCHPNDFANRVFVQSILKTLETGSEEDYIAGLADRITKYRYESSYDEADWANFCTLAETAKADILSASTAEEARKKYMAHADILDAVPTAAENIANSSIDVSNLIFNSAKPLDLVIESTTVSTQYDAKENALGAAMATTSGASVNLDYSKADVTASADDYDYVVYTVKSPSTNGTSRFPNTSFTFTTETGACKASSMNIPKDDVYHSYVIDMSAQANWAGNITNLKISPFQMGAKQNIIYISSVILATDEESAKDIAIERERAANKNAAEAVTYLMSDEMTTAVLTAPGGEKYLAGDIDGNGKIAAVDMLLLRRYLADDTVAVANSKALDVDGNGDVEVADALVLRYTIAEILEETVVDTGDAAISYSSEEKAAKIVLAKDNVTVTADLSESGLSADMFKYISVCAKNANGEAIDVTVTLNYADTSASKTISINSDSLFSAETAKFTDAAGDIVSVAFTFDAAAGETIYFDSFVLTATASAAENAEIVRVGAANLF